MPAVVGVPGGANANAAAVGQRAPQLEGGGVEGQRGDHQDGVPRPDLRVVLAVHQAYDVAVGDLDALGAPGGSRGVDEVGGVVRGGARFRSCVRVRLQLASSGVQQYGPDAAREQSGQTVGQRGTGDQQPGAGIGEHVADPLLGILRVDRYVAAARLDHAEQGDHRLRAALQADRDGVLGAHPTGPQQVGELIGPGLQFAVGHGRVAVDQRHVPGPGVAGDQLRQGHLGRRRNVRGGDGGPGQRSGAEGAGGGLRPLGHGPQHLHESGGHRLQPVPAGPARTAGHPQFAREGPHVEGELVGAAVGDCLRGGAGLVQHVEVEIAEDHVDQRGPRTPLALHGGQRIAAVRPDGGLLGEDRAQQFLPAGCVQVHRERHGVEVHAAHLVAVRQLGAAVADGAREEAALP